MNYLMSFLEKLNPEAYKIGKKIEDLIYDDPQSACFNGRLTLEAIINDVFKQEEIGMYFDRLFDKVIYLDNKGYLTEEVKRDMDTIRSLGNKAAHNTNFDDLENAIKVFKSTYKVAKWYAESYSLNIEIPEYRNPKPRSYSQDPNELVNKVLDKLRDQDQSKNDAEKYNEPTVEPEESFKEQPHSLINYTLQENQSYLLRELKKLQESSQEAVESPEDFSLLKEYLHVDRKIQIDLETMLEKEQGKDGPSLILLSGSVGDGKSHLLSYLKKNKPELLKGYRLYNDATESFDPKKSAIETLTEELEGFSDQSIDTSNDRIIIAINLGILNNFLEADHGDKSFNKLKQFVDDSQIFESQITANYSDDSFHIISFSDYQTFELTSKGPKSHFFESIFNKVFSQSDDNPFYQAYKLDVDRKVNWIVHRNFEFLTNRSVQKHVIRLLINTIVQQKLVISARALFNFISDIVIPEGYLEGDDFSWGPLEKLGYTTPNLLFDRKERSFILRAIDELDPIDLRSSRVDELLIKLNTLEDWEGIINALVDEPVSVNWLKEFISLKDGLEEGDNFTYASEQEFFKVVIRTAYLTSEELHNEVTPKSFYEFINYLYAFNKRDTSVIQDFYEKIKSATFKWKGSPKRNYIYLSNRGNFKVAQRLSLKPDISHLNPKNDDILYNFNTTLTVAFYGSNSSEKVMLNVDYYLYKLILSVLSGYCPNKKDEEDAIQFMEFIDRIMHFGNFKDELLVHIPNERKLYRLEKNEFGGFIFERET